MQKKLTIGLFGFGVVGEGIYRVLKETPTLNATIRKICIRHPEKPRSISKEIFTTVYEDLLLDDEINLIVELIDDADEAFRIVTTALRNKKAVVSANKKMIAEHLPELLILQKEHGVPFLYEAAVCGSIPVIRNLEEYYDNDLLRGICGIVNGSSNFILTRILEEGQDYEKSLLQAQQLGFAESNPELDVSGRDAVNKLTILLLHAYGIITSPTEILHRGITSIHTADATVAGEKGYRIKLIARAYQLSGGQIAALVLPHFITEDSPLYNVRDEYNGLVIESKLADKQFLSGKGAGRYPTSSAVLSDIAALRYDYRYEYRKFNSGMNLKLCDDIFLKIYISFIEWNQVNKWDFEWIEECYSTEARQWLVGVIAFGKLKRASWFYDEDISIIVMPEGILERELVFARSIKKLNLRLAGAV